MCLLPVIGFSCSWAPEFYKQFEYHFKMDLTEEIFHDLKGRIARLCSADGYEYNCNPKGTCNFGLHYKHCVSNNPKYEYGQRCTADVHPPIDFIHQSEVVTFFSYKNTSHESKSQNLSRLAVSDLSSSILAVPSTSSIIFFFVFLLLGIIPRCV